MIKLAIRGSTLQYASILQKARKNKLAALEQKLKLLEQELQNVSLSGHRKSNNAS